MKNSYTKSNITFYASKVILLQLLITCKSSNLVIYNLKSNLSYK